MTNIEQIEIIWESTSTKWLEKIEKIEQETIVLPNYDYWQSQEPLDAQIALRNSSVWAGGWLTDWWTITITWTWNYTISWMSFQPKYIEFVFLMWDMAFWQWKCYWNLSQFSWYTIPTALPWELVSVYSVYARSTEWNLRVRAKVTSINSDWFVLNNDFHNVFQTKVFYTCFW